MTTHQNSHLNVDQDTYNAYLAAAANPNTPDSPDNVAQTRDKHPSGSHGSDSGIYDPNSNIKTPTNSAITDADMDNISQDEDLVITADVEMTPEERRSLKSPTNSVQSTKSKKSSNSSCTSSTRSSRRRRHSSLQGEEELLVVVSSENVVDGKVMANGVSPRVSPVPSAGTPERKMSPVPEKGSPRFMQALQRPSFASPVQKPT